MIGVFVSQVLPATNIPAGEQFKRMQGLNANQILDSVLLRKSVTANRLTDMEE